MTFNCTWRGGVHGRPLGMWDWTPRS